jgi:hypothetical protein
MIIDAATIGRAGRRDAEVNPRGCPLSADDNVAIHIFRNVDTSKMFTFDGRCQVLFDLRVAQRNRCTRT